MRTTITLKDDVAAAVERRRRETGAGVSDVVNDLVRAGLAAPKERKPFVQKTSAMGAKYNLDNIGEVIEMLEGPTFWHE